MREGGEGIAKAEHVVTLENCHDKFLEFIKKNDITINNYEEDMKNLYLKMLLNDYRFICNREILTDIMIDIAFMLSPKDELNIEMVKNTLGTMECDSDSESDSDPEIDEASMKRLNRMQQQMRMKGQGQHSKMQ